MASQNLGSLTLNVVADLGQYTAPLEKAERLTQRAMRAMGISIDEFGNYTDKAMKKAAESTKVLDSQFDNLAGNMRREIELYGEVSRAAVLRYDLEKGALKSLSVEQKKSLSDMAMRLDAMDDANAAFKANANAVNQVTSSMRGFRGVATGIGYQLQDIAVQAQMGTSAFMILGQQGSQIASLFGPTGAIVGAFIAVGGAIAGALLPSLFKTGSAAEEVADDVAALVAELSALDDAQQKLVLTANKYSIDDQTKAYEEQGKRIEGIRKEITRLNAENDKMQYVTAGSGGVLSGSGSGMIVFVNNTVKLREATRELNEAEIARVATLKEIEKLRDPTGGLQEIRQLQEQVELVGLLGEELYRAQGGQKKYTGAVLEGYVALNLLNDAKQKDIDLAEKASKAAEDAAKKAAAEEKTRAEGIEKMIRAMEREVDLYGVTSRAAQVEYDILKKNIEVHGGLEGIEARRLLIGAERLDQLKREAELNDVLNIEIDQRIQDQIDADKKAGKSNEKSLKDMEKQYEQFYERIDQVGVDVWEGMIEGSTSAFDSIKKLFISTLAEMAHAAVTRPILMQFQQQFMPAAKGAAQAGAGQSGIGALGAGGIYAAAAIVTVAAINSWNKKQEAAILKLTAEVVQAGQSIGTVLGSANQKSESISNSISDLSDTAKDALDVNRGMLNALYDIRDGISRASAVFGRTGIDTSGVTGLGTSTAGTGLGAAAVGAGVGLYGAAAGIGGLVGIGAATGGVGILVAGIAHMIGGDLGGFVDGVLGSVSKAIYSKKKKIIDEGIKFTGESLADILAEGAIDAFSYATVQSKKKVLGVTTSNKTKEQTGELDNELNRQFALVFESAGEALGQAAEAFGLDFDDYINRLVIDPQKLSLKDLEGEALTKEIENFFSSTLDNWAGVLVDGSTILEQFQKAGEGAFETVIRLASELNTFNSYADALNLNFELVGFAAVEASQNIADAAGGFDKLNASLSGYYNNFFTEEERTAKQMELLSAELKEIGINAVPESREAFRALVEGLDLATEAGQEQFAALINLQGVFADLVPLTKEFADSAMSAADILKERAALEERLWRLTATTNDIRERELDAIHESNRSILEQIFVVEDLQAAEEALAEKRASIAAEIAGLEQQYFEQTASQAQKRDAVLSALQSDEARDIQKRIYALEDLRAAQEASTKASEDAAKAAQDAAKAARDAIGTAFSRLGTAISTQKKNLDEANSLAVKAITTSLDKHRQLADALSAALGSMSLESERYTAITRRQAQAQIIAANAIARAGGPLPTIESLSKAIDAVSQPSTQMFSNFEDYARDFYTTQRNLAELEASAGVQVSIDEKMLAAQERQHQEQIEKLDKSLEFYQAQLDALDGIDKTVLTVAEAIHNLKSLLSPVSAGLIPTKEPVESHSPFRNLRSRTSPGRSTVPVTAAPAITVAAERYGSQFIPLADKSFSDVLSEIQGLRRELEISQYHIAKNTQQSTTILQRWDADGLPLEREES